MGTFPGEDNEEFIAPFDKCVPNCYIMTIPKIKKITLITKNSKSIWAKRTLTHERNVLYLNTSVT